MRIGIPKETFPDEFRVAIVPSIIPFLVKKGLDICVEKEAGTAAGYTDNDYQNHGAKIYDSREEIFKNCDVILQVRGLGMNKQEGQKDLNFYRNGMTFIGFQDPLTEPQSLQNLAAKGVTVFAMELMPRITRAQSMDALSSMATVSGYKAVLLAANQMPKMFPMMMTAAGTISPAKVFIIGAGVAGLQAIASARRLGAVVKAYDLRPAVKEQVESLGASFVEIALETEASETKGGYAKDMGEEFYKKQREMMTAVVAESDVVITTAAIPGKKAPILVTSAMVSGMQPGSLIIDLAAERGGNCEETKPGEEIEKNGIKILGPLNLPSTVAYHASQMYSKNISNFLLHILSKGEFDLADEITRATMVVHKGSLIGT